MVYARISKVPLTDDFCYVWIASTFAYFISISFLVRNFTLVSGYPSSAIGSFLLVQIVSIAPLPFRYNHSHKVQVKSVADPGGGGQGGHANPPPSVPDKDYLLCTSWHFLVKTPLTHGFGGPSVQFKS